MWSWFKRRRQGEPAPLTGAPRIRRRKIYSADSGYVYEYLHEGYRVASRGAAAGAQYVFSVSADRKNWFPMTVFLPDGVTAAWERERRRDLNSTERYAAVKLALFRAFDEREEPSRMREEVWVSRSGLDEILETLGID